MINDINDINKCVTYEWIYIDWEKVIEEVDPLNNRRCIAKVPKSKVWDIEYENMMRSHMRMALKK